MPPLVSVVIATYNAVRYLRESLDSVLSQDYAPFEVLLIDDGSTDGSPDLVRSVTDPRLRYIQQGNSGGPSGPRNLGIDRSQGAYVFIFDSDDVMRPGKLGATVAAFERTPSAGLAFTDFCSIEESGRPFSGRFLDGYPGFSALVRDRIAGGTAVIPREQALDALLEENFIGTSSVAIPRRVLQEVGKFDEALKNSEDLDLWFRIARRHDLLYLDIVGHSYRVRADSVMAGGAARLAPNRIAVLERQQQSGVSPRGARAIRRWLARNYLALGYEQERLGRMDQARSHYFEGLCRAPSWRLVRSFLVTLMGRDLARRGKRLAARLRG